MLKNKRNNSLLYLYWPILYIEFSEINQEKSSQKYFSKLLEFPKRTISQNGSQILSWRPETWLPTRPDTWFPKRQPTPQFRFRNHLYDHYKATHAKKLYTKIERPMRTVTGGPVIRYRDSIRYKGPNFPDFNGNRLAIRYNGQSNHEKKFLIFWKTEDEVQLTVICVYVFL